MSGTDISGSRIRLIDCAACVKHFSADDKLEQVNASGMPIVVVSGEEFQQALLQALEHKE